MGIEREAAVDLANKFLGGFAEDIEYGLEALGMPANESRAALNHFIAYHRGDASTILNALYVGVSRAERHQFLAGIARRYYSAKSKGIFTPEET